MLILRLDDIRERVDVAAGGLVILDGDALTFATSEDGQLVMITFPVVDAATLVTYKSSRDVADGGCDRGFGQQGGDVESLYYRVL